MTVFERFSKAKSNQELPGAYRGSKGPKKAVIDDRGKANQNLIRPLNT
jgi:hypothetical protein